MSWEVDNFDACMGEEESISPTQMSIIEGLIPNCPLMIEVEESILRDLESMTYQEASDLIYHLKQIEIPKDPREQFKKFQF